MISKILKNYLTIIILIFLQNQVIDGKSLEQKDQYKTGPKKLNLTCIQDKIYFDTDKLCDAFILFANTNSIQVSELNENFSNIDISTDIIGRDLNDVRQIYYNLNENYIIYESGRKFHKLSLISDQSDNPNIKNKDDYEFSENALKPGSKLAVDWIHNLLYFINQNSQIIASNIENLDHRIVIANKLLDMIICLAVNPIESFIVWFEHHYNSFRTVLNKALQDGSNRSQIFETNDYIREITIDYNSKRLFWLSSLELSSIDYDGNDKRVISESVFDIFDFDLLGDYVYWIESNGNQLFRASIKGFQTYESSVKLNFTINKFELVHNSKQPEGTNECLHSECSQFCLPVYETSYRCLCISQYNCIDDPTQIRHRKEPTFGISQATIPKSKSTESMAPKPTKISEYQISLSHSSIKPTSYILSESADYKNDSTDNSFRLAVIIPVLSFLLIILVVCLLIIFKCSNTPCTKVSTKEQIGSEIENWPNNTPIYSNIA